MKYLKDYKLFESINEAEIHQVCKKYSISNYTINNEGSIDVDGNVYLNSEGLTRLPVKFRNISGYFNCFNNKLTSLEGSPTSVGGYFDCDNNNLTSLLGAPDEVGDHFYCSYNKLTNLEGAPSQVGGGFYCFNNQLTSLVGLEWKSFKGIYLNDNPLHEIVKDWINNENRIDLIEYFIDINVIQDGETKPKLIIPRLEAFHEEMDLEMNIDFGEVKKYYEIIEG